MSIGAQALLLIGIIICIFLENKKAKFGIIGLTLFLWIFGRFFLHISNAISIIYAIVIIVLSIVLLVIEKNKKKTEYKNATESNENLGLKIVSFLFPLVGLIVYAVNIVQNPDIAKQCGKWALIGFCIGLILSISTICIVMFA